MIERTEHEWGVRLTEKPFSTPQHGHMTIQADVHKPPRGQRKQVYVTFRGTAGDPFRYADARTWQAAYSALIAEVDDVADELAPKKKATKKAAKKKAKRKKKS